jgi:hypothetical protein
VREKEGEPAPYGTPGESESSFSQEVIVLSSGSLQFVDSPIFI